jgi:hypothetical protein
VSIPRPAVAAYNPYAVPALVLALVTLLLPIFIPAILGIIFGVLGLLRARRLRADGFPPLGRTVSGVAVGLGVFFLLYSASAIWIVLNVLPRLVWILFGGSWNSPPSG